MKKIHTILRIIAGLIFTLAGLSKIGITPNMIGRSDMFTPEAFAFISALDATGYIFPILGFFALVCGLLILFNRATAFAAVVMVPITLNFAFLHIFLGLEINSIFSFEAARESLGFIPLAFNIYILYLHLYSYV